MPTPLSASLLKVVPPAVLHLPHASTEIPPDERPSILLSDEDLQSELLRMTDRFTDELFAVDLSLAIPVIFPVSRLVVDVERFVDDSLEPMAAKGMGAVYTRTSKGELLRQEGKTPERERVIGDFYSPHQQQLTVAVQTVLDRWGSCLIIDGHSFASVPLPHEPDQSLDRPEICLGTDPFHTPEGLVSRAADLFERAGFRILVNRPFAGALVPTKYFRQDRRVSSLMIEVNRKCYMDEETGHKLEAFDIIRARLQSVVTALLGERLFWERA